MGLQLTSSLQPTVEALVGSSSPIVVVPVHDAYNDVVRCYEALFRNTPTDTTILVMDDASIDRRVVEVLSEMAARIEHRVVIWQLAENQGFVGTCNLAFDATRPCDVVLVNSDVIVGPEWLERLREAAASSSTIATASTLTNHGSILSVPYRNSPSPDLPAGMSIDEAARRIAEASARSRPTIPTAVGHCVLIRRAALELVGGFDPAFSPGYGEEVDFSQRIAALGYRHICVDDVFTFHRGNASFARKPEARRAKEAHDALNEVRYPHYRTWVASAQSDPRSPLADAIANARRALLGLTVGVDARLLSETATGSRRVVAETVGALARHPSVKSVHAYVPMLLDAGDRDALEAIDKVQLHPVHDLTEQVAPTVEVMYRPYQVRNAAELQWLRSVGHRLIVNQLDLIAFRNATYFGHVDDWMEYRDLTRLTGAVADGLAFLSHDAKNAAFCEGIVPLGTPTRVVGCGVDHTVDAAIDEKLPRSESPLEDGFLLCLGVPFAHKNRPFAIQVWRELRNRGWRLPLVFAGPTPSTGASIPAEARIALEDREAAQGIVDVGSVSEAEKRWLYRHAGLVLYPTAVEGFGLVPFEAAQMQTATLTTRQGSLDEVLPQAIPTISTWDVGRAADVAWELLKDTDASNALIAAIENSARTLTWDRTAEELVGLMNEALAVPASRVISMSGETDWVRSRASDGLNPPRSFAGKLIDYVATRLGRGGWIDAYLPPGSPQRKSVSDTVTRIRRRV